MIEDRPENDPKFIKPRNEIGFGLEYVYYTTIVKYGFFQYDSMIENAVNPTGKNVVGGLNRDDISKIFDETGLGKMMSKKWTDDYNERISTVYSAPAQRHISTNKKHFLHYLKQ